MIPASLVNFGIAAGQALWTLLKITLPIPLALVLATAAWAHFDKSSAVRRAVDSALEKAVAGAKISALEAKVKAEGPVEGGGPAAGRRAAASPTGSRHRQ